MNRGPRWLALLCCLVLASGCSEVEAGTPRPAENGAEPGGTSTSARDETNPLEGVAPCEVLTSEDEAEIGLRKGEQRGDQACDWRKNFEVGVLVMLFPQDGSGDAAEQGSPVETGTFDAYLFERPQGIEGECSLLMDTSVSSHVRIAGTTEKNTDAACELVLTVAERVDDRLS